MKAIILVRVSTKQQHLDKQRDELITMAKYDGFGDENIIVIENKESALKIKDETESLGLTKMFNLIETDSSIKCVYAYELSRIGRKQIVNERVKDFLVSHKVNLKIKEPSFSLLDKDGNLNNATELVFSLFNTMAAQEMRLKKVRMSRGMAEAKDRGEIGSGTCLFGYYVGKDKKIYVDEEKANTVRYIFNAYKDGMTPQKIFSECYEMGWLTQKANARTITATINNILSEKQYIGTVSDNGVIRYPQIISKNLWEEVEALRKANRLQKKNTKNIYLGQGILFCNGKHLCGKDKTKYFLVDKTFTITSKLVDFILWSVTKDLQLMTDTKGAKEKIEELETMEKDLVLKMENNKKHQEELNEKQEKIEEIYILSKKTKEWLQMQLSSVERERNNHREQYQRFYDEFTNIREALIHSSIDDAKTFKVEEMDDIFDTPQKRKEIINKHIKRVDIEECQDYRKITIESKKFGLLPYHFEYTRHYNQIKVFKVNGKKKEQINYK